MKTQIKAPTHSTVNTTPAAFQLRPFAAQNESAVGEQDDGSSLFDSYLQRRAVGGAGSQLLVQPKLTLGAAGDQYEQEADQVAKQVVGRINGSAGSAQAGREAAGDRVRRKPTMSSVPASHGSQVDSGIEGDIRRAQGSGQPLSEKVRAPMEQAFGANFGGVRLHTDAHSDRLNRSLEARAFTTGQDIFFGQGTYNPSSRAGQELLAHELTHVVQQNGAGERIQRAGAKSGNTKAASPASKGSSSVSKGSPPTSSTSQGAVPNQSKIDKAIKAITDGSDSEVKKVAEFYTDSKEKTNKSKNVSAKASVGLLDGEIKLSKEGREILTGITYLVEAKVISGASLQINAEFEKKLGPLKGKLKKNLELFAGLALKGKAQFNVGVAAGLNAEILGEAKVGTGATVKGEGEVSIDSLPTAALEGTAEAFVGAKARGEGKFSATPKGLSISGKAEALVGLEGKTEGSFAFKMGKAELLKVSKEASAILGASAKAEGEFELKTNKVKIKLVGGGALGIGGTAGGSVELDPQLITGFAAGIVVGLGRQVKKKLGKNKKTP